MPMVARPVLKRDCSQMWRHPRRFVCPTLLLTVFYFLWHKGVICWQKLSTCLYVSNVFFFLFFFYQRGTDVGKKKTDAQEGDVRKQSGKEKMNPFHRVILFRRSCGFPSRARNRRKQGSKRERERETRISKTGSKFEGCVIWRMTRDVGSACSLLIDLHRNEQATLSHIYLCVNRARVDASNTGRMGARSFSFFFFFAQYIFGAGNLITQ